MSGNESLLRSLRRDASQALIKMGRWQDAAFVYMRFAVACDRTKQTNNQNYAYLSAVLSHLAAGDTKTAWQTYQDAMMVPCFTSSDQALAADALFVAYASGDTGAVGKCVASNRPFQYVDNAVGLAARQLPVGNFAEQARLAAEQLGIETQGPGAGGTAAQLGGVDETGEEDLT